MLGVWHCLPSYLCQVLRLSSGFWRKGYVPWPYRWPESKTLLQVLLCQSFWNISFKHRRACANCTWRSDHVNRTVIKISGRELGFCLFIWMITHSVLNHTSHQIWSYKKTSMIETIEIFIYPIILYQWLYRQVLRMPWGFWFKGCVPKPRGW